MNILLVSYSLLLIRYGFVILNLSEAFASQTICQSHHITITKYGRSYKMSILASHHALTILTCSNKSMTIMERNPSKMLQHFTVFIFMLVLQIRVPYQLLIH